MSRPLLLDLFCGAGGAAMGYHRAGFDVVGVDIKPQKHYPFEFFDADAMEVLEHQAVAYYVFEDFDAIHASPPCQGYSRAMKHLSSLKYPLLIENIRAQLKEFNYVIENVQGAPLIRPLMLCGAMFGLDTYRHRLFETSFSVPFLFHRQHGLKSSRAGHWKPGTLISVAGNCAPFSYAKKAMEIDWMTRDELAEAIPPAYTEFIGKQLIEHINP